MNQVPSFQCSKCPISMASEKYIEEHIANQHLKWARWKCGICKTIRFFREELLGHMHLEHKMDSGEIIYLFNIQKEEELRSLVNESSGFRFRQYASRKVMEAAESILEEYKTEKRTQDTCGRANSTPSTAFLSLPAQQHSPNFVPSTATPVTVSSESHPMLLRKRVKITKVGNKNSIGTEEEPIQGNDYSNGSSIQAASMGSGRVKQDPDMVVNADTDEASVQAMHFDSSPTTSNVCSSLQSFVSNSNTTEASKKNQAIYSGQTQSNVKFNSINSSRDDRMKCKLCGSRVSVRQLRLHIFNHLYYDSNVAPFECTAPYCDYKSYMSSNVMTHIKNEHSARFEVRENITPAIERRISELHKECFANSEVISMNSEEVKDAIKALMKHNGKFECRKCESILNGKDLKSHAFTHLKDTNPNISCFKCSFPDCSYTNYSRGILVQHVNKMHSGEGAKEWRGQIVENKLPDVPLETKQLIAQFVAESYAPIRSNSDNTNRKRKLNSDSAPIGDSSTSHNGNDATHFKKINVGAKNLKTDIDANLEVSPSPRPSSASLDSPASTSLGNALQTFASTNSSNMPSTSSGHKIVTIPKNQKHSMCRVNKYGRRVTPSKWIEMVQPRAREGRIACNLCKYTINLRQLRVHALTHLYAEEKLCIYACPATKCSYEQHSKAAMALHLKRSHQDGKKYEIVEKQSEEIDEKLDVMIQRAFGELIESNEVDADAVEGNGVGVDAPWVIELKDEEESAESNE